jgi:hypothetical protein
VTSPDGNVRVIVSVENNGVDVMKVTVADAPAPTAVLIVRAVAGAAVTAPTAGVLAKAAMVSLEVSILNPPGTAAVAASVRPEHTTLTSPGATLPVTVMTMIGDTNTDDEVVAGVTMVHLSTSWAVTRPVGNARVILSLAPREVEVVNEIETLLSVPTPPLIIVIMGHFTQLVQEP